MEFNLYFMKFYKYLIIFKLYYMLLVLDKKQMYKIMIDLVVEGLENKETKDD